MLGAALIGGAFFWNAYTRPITYTAPLTFMLNDEDKSSIGAGAILGSLGLGGATDQGGNAPKLLELGKSRKVLGKVLFDSALVDGKRQVIADHLIEVYDYHSEWEDSEALRGYLFKGERPKEDDRIGNRVLKSLHNRLVNPENGLMSITVDELSGIFTIRVSTLSEDLSLVIAEGVYHKLSDYFITSSIADKEQTLIRLNQRADSVSTALRTAEASLARFQDRSALVPLRQSSIQGQQLNREVLILSAMYGEIVKNRETAAFLLDNEKPAFNLVDGPLAPLRPVKESTFKAILIGGLLGVFLIGVVQFFRKLYTDAMFEDGDVTT